MNVETQLAPISSSTLSLATLESTSFQEATLHIGWYSAMDSEIKAIHDNHTWTLVPRTLYTSVIFAHWFYKVKPGINGLGEKLKVR
jgi:hypothetical protein